MRIIIAFIVFLAGCTSSVDNEISATGLGNIADLPKLLSPFGYDKSDTASITFAAWKLGDTCYFLQVKKMYGQSFCTYRYGIAEVQEGVNAFGNDDEAYSFRKYSFILDSAKYEKVAGITTALFKNRDEKIISSIHPQSAFFLSYKQQVLTQENFSIDSLAQFEKKVKAILFPQ